jgi:hypothetical protein
LQVIASQQRSKQTIENNLYVMTFAYLCGV